MRTILGLNPVPPGLAAGALAATFDGTGEVLAVFDSGVDAEHPDLEDRIVAWTSAVIPENPDRARRDPLGHGTHVAGIIAGTGRRSDGCYRGVAPGAKLVSIHVTRDAGDGLKTAIETFIDFGDVLRLGVERGAKILNLSFAEGNFEYDQMASSIDEFAFQNPEVLVVVASGNEGRYVNGAYEFNKVGAPANAKNVLTVGASSSDRDRAETWAAYKPGVFGAPVSLSTRVAGDPDYPMPRNSRGPTFYDSIKPDVLAPGTFIISTRSSEAKRPAPMFDDEHADPPGTPPEYGFMTGSSMAAPVVAGAAAVVRQYLRGQGIAAPTAALLKAVLIASARRMRVEYPAPFDGLIGYPDYVQGFGRIDLARVLGAPVEGAENLACIDVGNGDPTGLISRAAPDSGKKAVRTFKISVKAGTALSVVLCWTDMPGRSPQNILYLQVWAPDGERFLGNEENRYKKFPNEDSAFGKIYDKYNTVERVTLEKPEEGEYTVRIIARNTIREFNGVEYHAGFALCACGNLISKLVEV